MELRHLEAFAAVADELHFGRAAKRLQLSQPPLSQRIQQLERELGVELFARTSRRVSLTHAGRLLLQEAERVLAQTAHLAEVAELARQGLTGAIRVGYVGSSLLGPLPALLRSFRSAAPEVRVRLTEGLSPELADDLATGQLDIVFAQPVTDERIRSVVIDVEPIFAVLPSDHRLAGEQALDLAALARDPFVLFPRALGPGYMDVVLTACRQAGFTPDVVRDASAIYSIVGLVAAGQGVSLVPKSVSGLQLPGVVFRPVITDLEFELSMAWRPSGESDAVVTQFRHHATAQPWSHV